MFCILCYLILKTIQDYYLLSYKQKQQQQKQNLKHDTTEIHAQHHTASETPGIN